MQVGKRAAAKLIVDGTHRLSTDEDIDAYEVDQQKRKDDAIAATNLSRGIGVFQVQSPKKGHGN
jgi:hypothetical protein